MSELPSDYEVCGVCGYDHSYEYEHASAAHIKLDWEEKARLRKSKETWRQNQDQQLDRLVQGLLRLE